MYTVRVKHISAKRDSYSRLHVITIRQGRSVTDAIWRTGAVVPVGVPEPCTVEGRMDLAMPCGAALFAMDPEGIVVNMEGSSVYVDVPYKCTFHELLTHVIPKKLRHIGVHSHDIRGALADDSGRAVHAGNIWCGRIPKLWWTKLRTRVRHTYSPSTLRGIRQLQAAARLRYEWCDYELL